MFLIVMVIGLVGLAMLALPAFARHGVGPSTHGHGGAMGHGSAAASHLPAHGHGPATVHGPTHGPTHGPAHASTSAEPRAGAEMVPGSDAAPTGFMRWLPSPRGVFTFLALYGAFGNALVEAFHLTPLLAALAGVLPTLLVDRLLVRPLWNVVFRLHARPSASLGELILNDAVAVVPFRNGRGIVSTNREGRIVQLPARLCDDEASLTVKVGDRLRIEAVDAERERVTVSVLRKD